MIALAASCPVAALAQDATKPEITRDADGKWTSTAKDEKGRPKLPVILDRSTDPARCIVEMEGAQRELPNPLCANMVRLLGNVSAVRAGAPVFMAIDDVRAALGLPPQP